MVHHRGTSVIQPSNLNDIHQISDEDSGSDLEPMEGPSSLSQFQLDHLEKLASRCAQAMVKMIDTIWVYSGASKNCPD